MEFREEENAPTGAAWATWHPGTFLVGFGKSPPQNSIVARLVVIFSGPSSSCRGAISNTCDDALKERLPTPLFSRAPTREVAKSWTIGFGSARVAAARRGGL